MCMCVWLTAFSKKKKRYKSFVRVKEEFEENNKKKSFWFSFRKYKIKIILKYKYNSSELASSNFHRSNESARGTRKWIITKNK